jgi:hypothetical protein
VGTFSVAQRDAVRDELELLLREHPDVDRYFSTSDGEPYFVKNLESLQGDERDVILISIGYVLAQGTTFRPGRRSDSTDRRRPVSKQEALNFRLFGSSCGTACPLGQAPGRLTSL